MEWKEAISAALGHYLVSVPSVDHIVLVDVVSVVTAVSKTVASLQGQGRFHCGCLYVDNHSLLLWIGSVDKEQAWT